MQIDSIIFDLDGTLWDSVDEVILTWNRVLARYPGLREPIDRAEQESLMGLQMDEIARRLFPSEAPERQAALMEECVQEENRYLYLHGGRLYPDVERTLTALHVRYPLYIISNCQSGYIEIMMKHLDLNDYVTDKICHGDNGLSKAENIKLMNRKHGLKRSVYVGDTIMDANACIEANEPFIFASYGFGHVDDYDFIIDEPKALLNLFK